MTEAAGTGILLDGTALWLDATGVAFWPARRWLLVADLHLGTGASWRRRGRPLPAWDTAATLDALEHACARLRPALIVSLGDGFHDREAAAGLAPELGRRLAQLGEWIWIAGNHDPDLPAALPGRRVASLRADGLVLRHLPGAGEAGIFGHMHPVVRLVRQQRRLVRRCFVGDGRCLLLPAFGAYTGGLDAGDPAIVSLFGADADAFLLSGARLRRLPLSLLSRQTVPPGRRARPAAPARGRR